MSRQSELRFEADSRRLPMRLQLANTFASAGFRLRGPGPISLWAENKQGLQQPLFRLAQQLRRLAHPMLFHAAIRIDGVLELVE